MPLRLRRVPIRMKGQNLSRGLPKVGVKQVVETTDVKGAPNTEVPDRQELVVPVAETTTRVIITEEKPVCEHSYTGTDYPRKCDKCGEEEKRKLSKEERRLLKKQKRVQEELE